MTVCGPEAEYPDAATQFFPTTPLSGSSIFRDRKWVGFTQRDETENTNNVAAGTITRFGSVN